MDIPWYNSHIDLVGHIQIPSLQGQQRPTVYGLLFAHGERKPLHCHLYTGHVSHFRPLHKTSQSSCTILLTLKGRVRRFLSLKPSVEEHQKNPQWLLLVVVWKLRHGLFPILLQYLWFQGSLDLLHPHQVNIQFERTCLVLLFD